MNQQQAMQQHYMEPKFPPPEEYTHGAYAAMHAGGEGIGTNDEYCNTNRGIPDHGVTPHHAAMPVGPYGYMTSQLDHHSHAQAMRGRFPNTPNHQDTFLHSGDLNSANFGGCLPHTQTPQQNMAQSAQEEEEEEATPPHRSAGFAKNAAQGQTVKNESPKEGDASPNGGANSDGEQKGKQMIYPWMKKVHMGNSGDCPNFFTPPLPTSRPFQYF